MRGGWLARWGPVLVYMGAIFVLSSRSDAAVPSGVPDKAVHAVVYLGLALTVARAVAGGARAPLSARGAWAALLVTVAYGASDEIHQLFVPGRVASLGDLAADAAGGIGGIVARRAWGIIWRRRHA